MVSLTVNDWVMLVYTVPKSSAQLHRQILDAVMHATYGFFVRTDSGTTLNRFSNDMSIIEGDLAAAVMQTLNGAVLCLGSAMLIAAGSSYAALAMPFLIIVLYCIQKFYLRSSRQLRFLELEAQAPLLTHCAETIDGAATIRAFNWQFHRHEKCLDLLDGSQKPYYLLLCVQRWLNLVLGLLTTAIAVVVVSLAVMLRSTTSAGAIGVSLLNVLTFSGQLANLVNAWTKLESSLGAIARCKDFEAHTPREDMPGETEIPPLDWPEAGNLEISHLTASYNSDVKKALSDVSVSITAGEKVGICGRSGSGKSSLLLSPLRLLDHSAGSIILDDIDLSHVPRQTIRERLTALPQEVITFPGSARLNLDPFRVKSDADIESALKKVGLLAMISQRGGLEAPLTTSSLSQGQLQLLAVARALLCKSKVLILDEMTSSMDAETEDTVIRLIKEEFKDSTVIAIAHHLRTIADFDKIVVMDAGVIVENGKLAELLSKPDGYFNAMWDRLGHH